MLLSPVTDVVFNVLQSLHPNKISRGRFEKHFNPKQGGSKIIVKPFSVFSYREDFDSLWGGNNKGFSGLNSFWHLEEEYRQGVKTGGRFVGEIAKGSITTIIVWDGFPQIPKSGVLNAQGWVTPIDWSVCAALNGFRFACATSTMKKVDVSSLLPNWRVMIVDLASHHCPGSESVSLFSANPALLPWVRVYKPVLPKSEIRSKLRDFDNIIELLGGDLETSEKYYSFFRAIAKDDLVVFFEDIKNPERIAGVNSCCQTLEAMASIWSDNIIRSGDRHKVANLITPMILLEGVKSQRISEDLVSLKNKIMNPQIVALTEELRALQLMAIPDNQSGPKREHIKSIRDTIAKTPDLQVVLLDDQYRRGYQDILEHVLAGKAQLICHDRSKEILRTLETKWKSMTQPITTPGWRGSIFDQPTILLLDLRLWSDSDTMKSFFKELADIFILYKKIIREPLDEQRKMLHEDWEFVKASISLYPDKEDLIALTILPRLISIVDPFLPIILFTSASQRQTLERFTDYPSIITSFRKPMPTGYGANVDPTEYLENLAEAFKRAIEICRLGFIGNRISEIERKCFFDSCSIKYKKFKNSATYRYDAEVTFDSIKACQELRRFSQRMIKGDFAFGSASPYFLIERWYKAATSENRFKDTLPDEDFWLIADPRNAYAHGDADYELLEGSAGVDYAEVPWRHFLTNMLVIE